jgi:hypothetical protein
MCFWMRQSAAIARYASAPWSAALDVDAERPDPMFHVKRGPVSHGEAAGKHRVRGLVHHCHSPIPGLQMLELSTVNLSPVVA